jgi:hypothetical protein
MNRLRFAIVAKNLLQQLQVRINKIVRATKRSRESRDRPAPLWALICFGAECAGAGAGAGNADILDLLAIPDEELDAFLLDIGVV